MLTNKWPSKMVRFNNTERLDRAETCRVELGLLTMFRRASKRNFFSGRNSVA